MARQAGNEEPELPPVRELTYEEGWELLDSEARRLLGMSGAEFVRKWDAGEIDFDDPDTHSAAVSVWMLLPFVREERYGE